jgi:hypothetical protein
MYGLSWKSGSDMAFSRMVIVHAVLWPNMPASNQGQKKLVLCTMASITLLIGFLTFGISDT